MFCSIKYFPRCLTEFLGCYYIFFSLSLQCFIQFNFQQDLLLTVISQHGTEPRSGSATVIKSFHKNHTIKCSRQRILTFARLSTQRNSDRASRKLGSDYLLTGKPTRHTQITWCNAFHRDGMPIPCPFHRAPTSLHIVVLWLKYIELHFREFSDTIANSLTTGRVTSDKYMITCWPIARVGGLPPNASFFGKSSLRLRSHW